MGGLPRLRHRQIEGRVSGFPPDTDFPESWAALGDRIRVEDLNFTFNFSDDWFARVVKAIVGLAFCPQLRRMYVYGYADEDVSLRDALLARRARMEVIAAWAPGGDPAVLMARLEAADAPLRAVEARRAEEERKKRMGELYAPGTLEYYMMGSPESLSGAEDY